MNKLLTAAEAARRLGLSEHEVAELVERGELQALWIGGEVLRFHPDDLAAWRPRREAPRPSAPRGPVATVQGPPTEPSAPTSLGRSGLTTVSSSASEPWRIAAPATWQDRCLEFVYTYDGYLVTALLVLTVLVAFFIAPHQ